MTFARLTVLIVTVGCLQMGCETVGKGITKRQFNSAWENLEAGYTPEKVLLLIGEPREKHPPSAGKLATWIYSQPEVVGTRTTREDVSILPDGKTIPVYETEDVMGNVEYHLRWEHGYLVTWERVVPRQALN
ncbi:MAG: hypothetical protein SynsKO_00220 [Synoicihabitans sp.]